MIPFIFQLVAWILRNPSIVLALWVAGWSTLLYRISATGGWVPAFQVGLAGIGNLTSPVGIAIPLVLLMMMYIKYLIPWLLKSFAKLAVSLWHVVQQEMIHGATSITKALKKVKASSSPYSVGSAQEQPDLQASVGELVAALEEQGYYAS